MPNAAQHRAKAERNRAFLDTGLAASRPDWASVVAFYTAVHLVERLAAIERSGAVHNPTHTAREQWLATHRRHRTVFRNYMHLKRAGEIARYGTINQFEQMFDAASVQTDLIDTHLVAIEEHVRIVTKPTPPAP